MWVTETWPRVNVHIAYPRRGQKYLKGIFSKLHIHLQHYPNTNAFENGALSVNIFDITLLTYANSQLVKIPIKVTTDDVKVMSKLLVSLSYDVQKSGLHRNPPFSHMMNVKLTRFGMSKEHCYLVLTTNSNQTKKEKCKWSEEKPVIKMMKASLTGETQLASTRLIGHS